MLFALVGLAYLLLIACGIASLVFFIMVVVQMFKRDQSTLGIVCIVLAFCGGPLIAFIFGWIKSAEWDLKKTMTYWSGAIALQFVAIGLMVVSGLLAAATMVPDQGDFDPNNMNFEFELDDSQFNFEGDFNMPDDATMTEDAASPDDAAEPEMSATDQP